MFTRQTSIAELSNCTNALCATIVCITLIAVSLMFISLSNAEEVKNMVKGGDFENDADKGQWRFVQGASDTTLKIDKGTAATGKASLFFEIDSADPDQAWKPYIEQAVTLEKGETYTLSGWFKAEKNRELRLVVQTTDDFKKWLNKRVVVETEWKEYWGTFTALGDKLLKIKFLNTSSGVSYWMDEVRFYKGEYEPTEREEVEKAVLTATGKAAITWATIKAQY